MFWLFVSLKTENAHKLPCLPPRAGSLSVLVIFPVAMTKHSPRNPLKKDELVLVRFVECRPSLQVRRGHGVGGSWLHCVHSQDTERHGCWSSAQFLRLIYPINARPSLMGWSHQRLGWIFPPQVIQSRNSFSGIPRHLLIS